MALKKDFRTSFGIDVPMAYHRVQRVQIVGKATIDFVLGVYKNEAESEYVTLKPFSCAYNIAGNNPIAQAYMFLKSTTEFGDAVDC